MSPGTAKSTAPNRRLHPTAAHNRTGPRATLLHARKAVHGCYNGTVGTGLATVLSASLCWVLLAAGARAADPIPPGSPDTLRDWRWLARPLQGERTIVSDPFGKRKLPAADGQFLLLEADGPGVLDHVWTISDKTILTIVPDGTRLWSGNLSEAARLRTKDEPGDPLFPVPLVFEGDGMRHLVAPVGFRKSLRILADRDALPHFLSYRRFAAGTGVFVASPDPNGEYAKGLRAAAAVWELGALDLRAGAAPPERELRNDFALQAGGRVTVLDIPKSGELVRLEFHLNPPLTGTLREVVAEFFYDGAAEPALRLPITDLAGVPHPWPNGRWDNWTGTLAAGIFYPWQIHTPRFVYREATVVLNLPVPFARGMRVELWNRSDSTRFAGFVRAVVAPLSRKEALKIGRLCGTRAVLPVAIGAEPQPLLRVPGPGQWAGLGLFLTGCTAYPAAVRTHTVALVSDGQEPVVGPGLLPLWFQGAYGGAVTGAPIWNHPRYEDQFAGLMRHFLTDPIAFREESVFLFAPGTEASGAPNSATVVALWYRFSATPYAAPALPDRAERLPYSNYLCASQARPGSGEQTTLPFWIVEAEDLAPMATVHGGQVSVIEDVEHDYHPSKGKYLQILGDGPGDYVDFAVRFPPSRYFAVGTYTLWGPNRGVFELDILSKTEAKSPPTFPQGDAFYTGRILGSVPMKAPIMAGRSLSHRRDPWPEFPPPFLNPAPDGEGIIRFICQTKEQDSSAYLMLLDQLRLDPAPARPGWREFEDALAPEVSGDMEPSLPEHGRFEWSGWGALVLAAREGASARFTLFEPACGRRSRVAIRGALGPEDGRWQARLAGRTVTLAPGKDDRELREWELPVEGIALPGSFTIEFLCTGPGAPPSNALTSSHARLTLDAWALR